MGVSGQLLSLLSTLLVQQVIRCGRRDSLKRIQAGRLQAVVAAEKPGRLCTLKANYRERIAARPHQSTLLRGHLAIRRNGKNDEHSARRPDNLQTLWRGRCFPPGNPCVQWYRQPGY